MGKMFIAETGEFGDIACVWVSGPGRKPPKVFDPQLHRFDPGEPAEYFGAGALAIMSWLAARQVALADSRQSHEKL